MANEEEKEVAGRAAAELVRDGDVVGLGTGSTAYFAVVALGERVKAACMDLLTALPARPLFDVILSSPPKHAGEPRDVADRGWHAGPHYRDVAALFQQARERLNPTGCLYVMLSSASDLDLLGQLIKQAGLRAKLAYERSFYVESMVLYELRPS